jgi:hypothetical protein
MKKVSFSILFILAFCSISFSQDSENPAQVDFAFWIGEWETESSTPPKWKANLGEDKVSYLLNGTLIEEIFTKKNKAGTNFQRGYMVYLHREKRWRHTIHDAKWGEYSFYGNKEGDKMVLYSDPESTRPGLRRETFYNITENEFDYKWETSKDGGKIWMPIWKIHYTRKPGTNK